MRTNVAIFSLTVAGFLLGEPGTARSQAQQARETPAPAPPSGTEEVAALYTGWALLAAGHPARASAAADEVLHRWPRSLAAATLKVEAEIGRAGSPAGLVAYETWWAGRRLEDGYLLHRVARAALREASGNPAVAVEALSHLAADGDASARDELARRMRAGNLEETGALAALGDEDAVRALIKRIETATGPRLREIQSLIQSRSPLAVPVLRRLLADRNFEDHVAAAAEGLGSLQAREAIPDLRRLVDDPSQLLRVRYTAAAGLYKLDDMAGIALLQKWLHSDAPHLVVAAARWMAEKPGDEWRTAVRRALHDADPSVRVQAADLLAPHDREAARDVLEQLLRDDNLAIREVAGKVVVRRLAGDFGTLRRFLRSGDLGTLVAAAGRILELTR